MGRGRIQGWQRLVFKTLQVDGMSVSSLPLCVRRCPPHLCIPTTAAFVQRAEDPIIQRQCRGQRWANQCPRNLPSQLRPLDVYARDATGDEAKDIWTFLITTDDEVAAIQFESLHFATLRKALHVRRRGLQRAPVRTSSKTTRERKC